MGVTKKPSGVNIIGLGAEDLNEFKPVDQLKDLYIQLTADGATEESMDYLAYLKSYAEHNQIIGLPIMPNGVNVWISNNGKTSAVEADDLSLEDGVYTICGIKCTNGTWDFSDAGQSGGGSGGGGGGFLVHVQFNESDNTLSVDKNYNEIKAAVLNGIFPAFVIDSELDPPDEGFVVPSLNEYGYDGSKEAYYIVLGNQSQTYEFTSASATGEMKTEPLG